MAIEDNSLLVYMFGTQEEIERHKTKHGDIPRVYPYLSTTAGILLVVAAPSLSLLYGLGMALSADIVYRAWGGFKGKKDPQHAQGLVGKVRHLYYTT